MGPELELEPLLMRAPLGCCCYCGVPGCLWRGEMEVKAVEGCEEREREVLIILELRGNTSLLFGLLSEISARRRQPWQRRGRQTQRRS